MSKNFSLLKLQNGSDVRGISCEGVSGESVNLWKNEVFKIGYAFAMWFSEKSSKALSEIKISVGQDSRITSESLSSALMAGFLEAGIKNENCVKCESENGVATTPSMFMSLVFEETAFDASCMITASHLPFNRNGIKFFTKDGGLESFEIKEILEKAQNVKSEYADKDTASLKKYDLMKTYSDYLKKKICEGLGFSQVKNDALEGLHIVVDAGNGAGGFFATDVLLPLGCDVSGSQFLEPDGMFPNHIPNPENKDAMASIKKAVEENSADLGLIFDTDVDRMSAVAFDDAGNPLEINRDSIIALMSSILSLETPEEKSDKKGVIVTDSVTSDRLTRFLENKLGFSHLCYKRGYKNVINKQKEINLNGGYCPLAMETSGHGALSENYYLDDGSYLAVKLVTALAKCKNGKIKGCKKIFDLIKDLEPLVEEGEYRISINAAECENGDFKAFGKNVLENFKKSAGKNGIKVRETFEGVRLVFDDDVKGWILLRMSLHDPVLPLNIESETEGGLSRLKETAGKLLKECGVNF